MTPPDSAGQKFHRPTLDRWTNKAVQRAVCVDTQGDKHSTQAAKNSRFRIQNRPVKVEDQGRKSIRHALIPHASEDGEPAVACRTSPARNRILLACKNRWRLCEEAQAQSREQLCLNTLCLRVKDIGPE